ncbi:ferric reductase NAD binding domain-containing protein [Hirsutella rhossiliensis]|uniref:Ferric reductase NAD binding domain-containing protein n=1 Tax=Hirsutella rhossiliensis TaxID=111463 RepID=A0A9P8SJ83_9HYPO|nr:ferric reductase NAD binding domain-containing protein [Hirsutella rhossiliensis]KAH0962796.1 ferric reductase NAD binding domain-containing protein [Hirsutella rhossiliensis]
MVNPIIQDQYTAARAYFASVVGILFVESLLRLPAYLGLKYRRGRPRRGHGLPHWKLTVLVHKLLTQPLPVPSVTDWHVADLIRFLVFVALNVVFGLNDNNYTTDYKLYGWLTIANGGLALLMAARTNLFSILLRIPSPVLLQYHRWAGIATVAHATAHFSYNTMHYLRTAQIATSFANSRIRIGLVAWLSLVVILLTALPVVRRRGFEVFYYAHALFFVFMVGALIHTTNGPEFLLPGFSLWVVDRAIRFAYNFRRIEVLSVRHYEGNVTKFKVKGIRTSHPGQVVWVQIPSVSFLNWHPFTVATEPGETNGLASIAVRGLGRYTKGVQHADDDGEYKGDAGDAGDGADRQRTAATASELKMRLDGPYGVGRTQWGELPVAVLVAGGIGITPAISIVSHLVKKAVPSNGGNGLPAPGAPAVPHIHLLWVVKETCHIEWFEDELRQLHALSSQDHVLATLDIAIYTTASASSTLDPPQRPGEPDEIREAKPVLDPWTVNTGRPDVMAWFDQVKQARAGMDAAVNVCGPRTLVNEVRKAAVAASWEKGLFHVEEEIFEL